MKRLRVAVLSLMLTAAASQVDAKTFRYAYRIDPASLDPHALAETFTLSWLGQVYEPLVGRGKNLELVPALAVKCHAFTAFSPDFPSLNFSADLRIRPALAVGFSGVARQLRSATWDIWQIGRGSSA